jgi:L-arabinonolactonase
MRQERAVSCIQAANAVLGEGPRWDPVGHALFWLDAKRPAIFRWTPGVGQTGHWPLPRPLGCLAPCRSGRWVLADADGFAFLDLDTGALRRIGDPEPELARNQFNDGAVDRAGRFWAGTMDVNGKIPTGSLYRLDADLTMHRIASGFCCLNGLGWSPDERTMYVTDSTQRTIWAYEFRLERGDIDHRRVFARLSPEDGLPDGLAVDSEGFVWSAIWDGWRLIRFAPDGTVDCELRLPVQRPTACAFGGIDGQTLYITSAADELNPSSLREGPLAGALFAVDLPVGGMQAPAFAG